MKSRSSLGADESRHSFPAEFLQIGRSVLTVKGFASPQKVGMAQMNPCLAAQLDAKQQPHHRLGT